MSTFIESRLLDKVAYGTQSGIEFRTDLRALRSGREIRSRLWQYPLTRFSIIYRALRPEDRELVVHAFRAAGGRHRAFRMRDPLDFEASRAPLGLADGTTQIIQLTKTYTFGPVTETQPIYKPVDGSVIVFADDVAIGAAVDTTTGLIQVTATAGAVLTWSGRFDKPVRFDSDELMWSLDTRTPNEDRLASTDISLTETRDI